MREISPLNPHKNGGKIKNSVRQTKRTDKFANMRIIDSPYAYSYPKAINPKHRTKKEGFQLAIRNARFKIFY